MFADNESGHNNVSTHVSYLVLREIRKTVSDAMHDVTGTAEERVVEAVSNMTANLRRHLRPPFRQVRATLEALTYNDDQVSSLALADITFSTKLLVLQNSLLTYLYL